MLRVIREDNLNVPSVYCDHCGERIHEADCGNYVWNPEADGEAAEMLFTHKRCHKPFQSSNHTVNWYACGLKLLPIYMEGSLAIDREDAVSWAGRYATL